jgi:hypothetical protein
MRSADADVAVAPAPATHAPTDARGQGRLARPPGWLWPVSIALQVASAAAITSSAYFFVDDWLFLGQARTQPLTISYLREGLFEHFSPVSRLLDKVLIHVAPGSFAAARVIELGFYAAALVAFAWVVRMIVGNRWLSLALTVAFGQSLFLARLLTWWTATANILPSTVCSLLLIGCYIRWRERPTWRWLAASLLAFLAALLDYETALLLPAFLLLLVFALVDDVSPRAWIELLRRERWMWLGLGLLEAVALYNFHSRYYFAMPGPTFVQLLHFLAIALPGTFVPAMVGIKAPESALGQHAAVIVACNLLAVIAVGLMLYLRPRSWRCLVAFILVSLITLIPLGINRISFSGVAVGHELYYQQPLQFMFLLLVAVAVATGRPHGRGLRTGRHERELAMPAVALLAAAVLSGYGALLVSSADAMADAYPWPQYARSYVKNFRASVRRVARLSGRRPVLLDQQVAAGILPPKFTPFDNYDELLPIIDSRISFDRAGGPIYVLSAYGDLVRVRFHPLASGLTADGTIAAVIASSRGRAPYTRRAGSCLPPSAPYSRLWIPLSRPVSLKPANAPFALRVVVHMPRRADVPIFLARSGQEVLDATYPALWPAGQDDQFAPLSIQTRVQTVGLGLPPGACVSRLALGTFADR